MFVNEEPLSLQSWFKNLLKIFRSRGDSRWRPWGSKRNRRSRTMNKAQSCTSVPKELQIRVECHTEKLVFPQDETELFTGVRGCFHHDDAHYSIREPSKTITECQGCHFIYTTLPLTRMYRMYYVHKWETHSETNRNINTEPHIFTSGGLSLSQQWKNQGSTPTLRDDNGWEVAERFCRRIDNEEKLKIALEMFRRFLVKFSEGSAVKRSPLLVRFGPGTHARPVPGPSFL